MDNSLRVAADMAWDEAQALWFEVTMNLRPEFIKDDQPALVRHMEAVDAYGRSVHRYHEITMLADHVEGAYNAWHSELKQQNHQRLEELAPDLIRGPPEPEPDLIRGPPELERPRLHDLT